MSRKFWVRRGTMAATGAVAALALGVSAASAHHCFIPMYSLSGPSSPNWEVVTAEAGAADPEFAGFEAACDEAVAAGYDALKAAGLPVGIKIKVSKTIGDPKGEERIPNPNGANGKGLEYFGAGSTLPFEMLETYIGAASAYDCEA
jgi:hypothetical protein